MNILVASASVHTTAAACDYLSGRVTAGDTVYVLTVEEQEMDPRDSGDAANVARVRLPESTVKSLTGSGTPVPIIREVVTEQEIDELLLGVRNGDPERAGTPPGSTVESLLSDLSVPVTILPL